MKCVMYKSMVTSAIALLLLSGCTTTQPGLVDNNNENTKKGGIIGAISGAVR